MSLSIMGQKYWNKLPNNLKSIENINTFKSQKEASEGLQKTAKYGSM